MAKDASRRLPAEERRAQLVAAALGLAEAEGFGAVTIRRVADAAGVSLGVVHYCFESKEELMGAAIANVVAALGEEISQTYARASEASEAGTGAEGLRQLLGDGLAAMWALIEQTPQLQILTYEITTYALRLAAENPDGSRALADRQYQVTQAVATEFLQNSAEHCRMRWTRPVESVGRLALTMIDGVALRWLIDRDSEAAGAALDELVDLVVAKAEPAD